MSVAQREAPRTDVMYYAKRKIGYEELKLDRGQVFRLKGAPNDALLIDLAYIGEVPKGVKPFPCRECGREFIDQSERDAHGHRMHETREYTPPPAPTRHRNESTDEYQNRLDEWAQRAGAMSDQKVEREAKEDDARAPLNLENTTASRS